MSIDNIRAAIAGCGTACFVLALYISYTVYGAISTTIAVMCVCIGVLIVCVTFGKFEDQEKPDANITFIVLMSTCVIIFGTVIISIMLMI